MSLQDKVMAEMKAAMKAKDSEKLEALRSVKSAILLANTESSAKDGLTEDEELKILQKNNARKVLRFTGSKTGQIWPSRKKNRLQ